MDQLQYSLKYTFCKSIALAIECYCQIRFINSRKNVLLMSILWIEIQVMCDTHKFKSVTKSLTWHTKYANAHNVIPIIRSRVYCVVSAAKSLLQPKTLVRKYQTILRFILDLLKLGKSLEKNLECTLHISCVIQNQ